LLTGSTPITEVGIVGADSLASAIDEELRLCGLVVRRDCTPARLGGLRALIIVSDSDAANVEFALRAKQAMPALRIVVRVFDAVLERYLEQTAPEIRILTMSAIAAPRVVARLDESRLKHRGRVSNDASAPPKASWLMPHNLSDRMLPAMIGFVLVILSAATVYFAHALNLSPGDSFYFVAATITTTGYGDITPKDAPASVKFATSMLMLVGTASFAVLFALITDALFAQRLRRSLGRVSTRLRGHVILAGAGHMTARIADLLRARGIRILVIEQDANARMLYALREARHRVLIGDATRAETLGLAGVTRALGVIALTDSDASNLQVALLARSQNSTAAVLARIDSPLLCDHIERDASVDAFSPVQLAAKAFVDAISE
jgi:voltage-gated potassium channel Kch